MSVKLNLGAGLQNAPGFINYDRSRMALLAKSPVTRRLLAGRTQWPPETKVHDLSKGVPHDDASVDVIYSSHMLEHFTRDDAEALLRECFRVLKPGGLLRMVVPDLRAVVTHYLEGDRAKFGDRPGPLADILAHDLYGGSRKPEPLLKRTAKRVMRSDDGGHKWMYDEESLRVRLEQIGFVEVERKPRGESRDPTAAALDDRSDFHIHMEAVKPV